jgi:fucose 4-O-acetylase-like acetyltransferase
MKPKGKNRDYGFDNIRALLIVCVVFAHLLEIRAPFPGSSNIYRVIYSFHMPVFLFLCGWFARFDRTKIIFGLFIPYLFLQACYIFFQRWLYGSEVVLQFVTPYWLLWFLLALFFYHILLPLYDTAVPKNWLFVLGGTLVLSLLVGYDPSIGYGLTLSRLLVFQPWFLLGFYLRKASHDPLPLYAKLTITVVLVLCTAFLCWSPITNNMLYGSYPYATLQYHAGIRLFLSVLALLWILFFYFVIKPLLNFRIPLITALGQNTLPVFLLHGFFVKYIGYRHPQLLEDPLVFLAITCGILLLTGNVLVGEAFRWLMPDFWIKKWTEKKKETVS